MCLCMRQWLCLCIAQRRQTKGLWNGLFIFFIYNDLLYELSRSPGSCWTYKCGNAYLLLMCIVFSLNTFYHWDFSEFNSFYTEIKIIEISLAWNFYKENFEVSLIKRNVLNAYFITQVYLIILHTVQHIKNLYANDTSKPFYFLQWMLCI